MGQKEKYQAKQYNTQSLLNAIEGIEATEENEIAQRNENNLETHIQIMDSYREGTIDAHIDQSENDVTDIPRTGYNDMFKEE